ncbi:MAG: hypothetical protein AB7P76_11465 [Candidatus Melainabacteria bacterium]
MRPDASHDRHSARRLPDLLRLLCLLLLSLGLLAPGIEALAATAGEETPALRTEFVLPPFQDPNDPTPSAGDTAAPGAAGAAQDTGRQQKILTETDVVQFLPANPRQEMDLSGLEDKRFIRSEPVVSPSRDMFAYTEVYFIPDSRQTSAQLFVVPVAAAPAPTPPQLPSEELAAQQAGGLPAAPAAPMARPESFLDRYNPAKNLQARSMLVRVGQKRGQALSFRTLSVVDWSISGRRLMVKENRGVLHKGLLVSDVIIYDRLEGVVSVYPELERIVEYFWAHHGNQPELKLSQVSWNIEPLGWAAGSDNEILFTAWAYDQSRRQFLGMWRYDIDAERTTLLTTDSREVASAPVTANGLRVSVMPAYRDAVAMQKQQREALDPDATPDFSKMSSKEYRRWYYRKVPRYWPFDNPTTTSHP